MALTLSAQIQSFLTILETSPDAVDTVNAGKAFIASLEKDTPAIAVVIFNLLVAKDAAWAIVFEPVMDDLVTAVANMGEAKAQSIINAFFAHQATTAA